MSDCEAAAPEWEFVVPVPADAPEVGPDLTRYGQWFEENHGAARGRTRYSYRTIDGKLRHYVLRFEMAEGKKEIRPFALMRNRGTGQMQWRSQWPPRSFFGIEELSAHPDLPVIIFEGEAKAVAAAKLIGTEYVVLCVAGGAGSALKNDRAPLRGRELVLWPDNDEAGFKAFADLTQACESDQLIEEGAIRRSAQLVVPDKNWPAKHDVGDLIKEGWTREQLLDYLKKHCVIIDEFRRIMFDRYPPAWAQADADPPDAPEKTGRGPTQATILIELAGEHAEFFHDDDEPFATVVAEDGHHETHRLGSRDFKRWLSHWFFEAQGKGVGKDAIATALETLAARAHFTGEQRPTFLRIAGFERDIYLDLGDPTWRVVKISADGWSVIAAAEAPVRFRRAKGMLPLPVPKTGGSVTDLRGFVNLSDDDFKLYIAQLIMAYRPTGPYPIAALHGEQGAAKTTTARVFRELIDPNSTPLRSAPKDERDLMIAAENGLIIALDNLSYLPVWLSDCLCRLSTGGGFSTRQLYTNGEEALFNAQRPVFLTGITELAVRSDLLDRTIIYSLPGIVERGRVAEKVFWAAFEKARPGILGALLDAVSTAVKRIDEVKLDRLPRMADFALWSEAAAPALGWKPVEFLTTYAENRAGANALVLENPLAIAFQAFVNGLPDPTTGPLWKGTATQLLDLIEATFTDEKVRDKVRRVKDWPKAANALSNALRRLAPNLRKAGIEVELIRDNTDRWISIDRVATSERAGVGKRSSPSSSSSLDEKNPVNCTEFRDDLCDDLFPGDDLSEAANGTAGLKPLDI